MAKQPKAPNFQDLPELTELARKRGQTVDDVLADWGVVSMDSAIERCRREGVRPPADLSRRFQSNATPTSIRDSGELRLSEPIATIIVSDPPKPMTESEGKKMRKGKLTSRASAELVEADHGDERSSLDGGTDGKSSGET